MRAGLRWWILRKMWLIGSRSSRWAGQQMIALSRKADARDCASESHCEAAGTADEKPDGQAENVKEHAPLSARASVDHGVNVETTGEHVNRAADRGCCVSSCSPL